MSPDASQAADWLKNKETEDPGQAELLLLVVGGGSRISAVIATPGWLGAPPLTGSDLRSAVLCPNLQNVYFILFVFLCVSPTVLTGCWRSRSNNIVYKEKWK